MFDLIAGREKHLPGDATLPILISTSVQATVVALVVLLPILFVTQRLPEVPTMRRSVAVPPAPPPPPPPPPVAAKPKEAPKAAAAVSETPLSVPLEEPAQIPELPDDEGLDLGVPGGVEGGIPGGVVGGVVGGMPEAPPSPPAPPPPPAPTRRAPVRIGGQITLPQLVKRVDPVFTLFAVKARMQGVVILEATVSVKMATFREVRLLRGSAQPASRSRSRKGAAAMALFTALSSTRLACRSSSR